MTITRADLINLVRTDLKFTTSQAKEFVERFFEKIISTLATGETVKLPKFGIFKVRAKKARPGFNPITREVCHIPARHSVTFYAGVPMRRALKKVSQL